MPLGSGANRYHVDAGGQSGNVDRGRLNARRLRADGTLGDEPPAGSMDVDHDIAGGVQGERDRHRVAGGIGTRRGERGWGRALGGKLSAEPRVGCGRVLNARLSAPVGRPDGVDAAIRNRGFSYIFKAILKEAHQVPENCGNQMIQKRNGQ